jgi:hypothetical protein
MGRSVLLRLSLALFLSPGVVSAQVWGDVLSPNFSAYAASDGPTKDAALDQYMTAVNEQRSAGSITFSNAAQLKLGAAQQLFPSDAALHQLFAFIAMVGARLDRGEISIEEYQYEVMRKNAEYDAARQASAQQQEAIARQRYYEEMQRIDAQSRQNAEVLNWASDRIRQGYAPPRQQYQINMPQQCSTVPDGAGGFRTVCY